MRPISKWQNIIQYPLNVLLGSEAQVRILRVLSDDLEGPLTAPDIAERTGLTIPGTRKALNRLVHSGFLDRVGGGRRHQYALMYSNPLMNSTIAMFQAERGRYNELLQSLKKGANRLSPPPYSIWILNYPVNIETPLEIGILHSSEHLSESVRNLRQDYLALEKKFDITIEIHGYTRADLPDIVEENLILLGGIPPGTDSPTTKSPAGKQTHKEMDLRSLERCRVLVSMIKEDRSLIRRARNHLDRLIEDNQGLATGDLREWSEIMKSYSVHRLLKFLTSNTPRAFRLRQSCPLFAVLNNKERNRMLEALSESL